MTRDEDDVMATTKRRSDGHDDDQKGCRVRGRVLFADGKPVEGAQVVVLIKRVRCKDEELGKTKTKTDGRYVVEYRCAKTRVDILVEATKRDASARSGVVVNAGPDEVVDLVLGGEYVGPSAFEESHGTIIDVLQDECGDQDSVADLDEEEVALVSAKTGVDPAEVVLVRQGAALAKETKLSSAVFYALGRQKIPLALTVILATDPAKRREAVAAALAANQIPASMEEQVHKDLDQLDAMTVAEALREPRIPGESTLGSLLGTAGLPPAKRTQLTSAYVQHDGSSEEFWKTVRDGGVLTPPEIESVQHTLQLGAITLNHVPLVQALRAEGMSRPSDLARLERADWRRMVEGQSERLVGVGMPPDLQAAGLKATDYADMLHAIVEDAVPTARVAARAAHLPASARLSQFLTVNPEYEIRSMPVSSFLRQKPGALDFIPDPVERATFTGQLKGVERAYRIAPQGARLESMEVLLRDGVDSAHKIRTMGRTAFLRRYEGALGGDVARRLYSKANHAAAAAAILVARHGAGFDKTTMDVLPARAQDLQRFPDYGTLFGSLDFCSCEHCQSIYSPAAYLTDVLHWLDGRDSTGEAGSALDVLLDGNRRADLGTIELSCQNTNTPLPHIDLVNEILELAVAQPEVMPEYQTRGSAADLRVHPEHQHDGAYELLAGDLADGGRDAVYPFNLPFNLWLEEARVYLGHLGVPRPALMEALHVQGIDAALLDASIAAESFGMSPLEWDLIAGKALAPPRAPEHFWGFSGDPSWVERLRTVSTLLEKATPPLAEQGMSYAELTDLLRTDFVQAPEQEVGIWFEGGTCDTERATLVGLEAAHLERLHRFIRLRRRLGWTAQGLDFAIQVLGGGVLDEALLLKLAIVRRLQGALAGIGLAEILTWWGPLDTRRWSRRLVHGRPNGISADAQGIGFVFQRVLEPTAEHGDEESFYDRLFLNRSVAVEPGAAFHVNADGTALVDETLPIADHSPAIAAALGVTADDLGRLIADLPDARLSLANLSRLYRHVSLARALGVSMGNLLSLLALTGLDPFDAAAPASARSLVEEVRAIRASGLSVDELEYLLRHRDTKPATLEPENESIGVLLIELRDALRKVAADHPDPAPSAPADELREALARELAALLTPDQIADVMRVVDLKAGAALAADAGQIVATSLAAFLDVAAATAALTQPGDPAYLGERTDRLRYVLELLVMHRRRLAAQSAVVEKLSTALAIDPAIGAPLLKEHVRDPGPGAGPALQVFLDTALTDYDVTDPATGAVILPGPADLPAAFATYKRLHKVALLVSRLRVAKDEVAWVFYQGPANGTFDVNDLPVEPASAAAPYAAWARLREAIALRDRVAGGRLFDFYEMAAHVHVGGDAAEVALAHEALLTELERRTRWSRADLEFLVGVPPRGGQPARPSPLGLVYPADWRDERALERIDTAMVVVRRIGLAAETLWPWRAIPGSLVEQDAQAQAIKQAVRARHAESEWRDVARPLRDRLRERQRDALAGWLVAHDGRFRDAHDLFGHFLIDVEMSPCQLTSRLRQAMSSVQLFVQRALMNLESDVALSIEDGREWKWMKNYRVWEANRKVFLYPENWIEPELRDDKSPFFEELENELLQGEMTNESAERAVVGYLERLDEVARLDVVGVLHQIEDSDVLHVFARTRGTPPRYFYRKRIDGVRWTPWERVDVDIEGDHLLPVVFNRRLYLFWTQITDVAIERVVGTPNGGGHTTATAPERYYQLRLSWSERRGNKWLGKKLSTVQIGATEDDYSRLSCGLRKTAKSKKSDFFFRTVQNGDLLIEPIRFVRAESKKDSDFFVRLDRFRMSGCDGTLTLEQRTDSSKITVRRPGSTETANQAFASTSGGVLSLPARNPGTWAYEYQRVLGRTDGAFQVVPQVVADFRSQAAFFFQDLRRTFYVEPRDVYRWVRQPPRWTLPDRVPIDLVQLYPELRRPSVPRPDPWLLDRESVVRDPAPILVKAQPAVVSVSGSRVSGLPAHGAAGLVDTFGSRVAYVGGEAVTPRPLQIAVFGKTDLVSEKGTTLFSLRSAGAPAEAGVLQALTMESRYTLPALQVNDLFIGSVLRSWAGKRYRLETFYHPFVCRMLRQLNRYGLEGLLDPSPTGPEPLLRRQRLAEFFFEGAYAPTAVDPPFPRDEFDFSYGGAYSSYNWEVFFHVPFTIACWLSKNQRFEEAQRWFHYIFDPTESSRDLPAPQRFWKLRPFFELFHREDVEAGPIRELLLLLQYDGDDPDKLAARDQLIAQIGEWRKKPFQPHAIARLRLTAYQKAVVMKYVDNLIEWGDHLFRQDTMESINEATQLYILAAQILGRRPREVTVEPPRPRTFNELRALGLDALSNTVIEEVEGYLPEMGDSADDPEEDTVPVVGPTPFFCIPPNGKLLTDYWDRVADRLFKLRHCMNIEGVVRQLPLFEPPIDPGLLVRAAAAGIDLASALSDLDAPLPYHRYQVLIQKANELCNDVRGLGQTLLATLEKKDAEKLALLRADHEIKLQKAMRQVRERQIQEAKETLEGLRRSKENAEIRVKYYRSRQFMNAGEKTHKRLSIAAGVLDASANVSSMVASIVGAIPDFDTGAAGFGGSPMVKVRFGGTHLANVFRATADGFRALASGSDRAASLANVVAGYERRRDDWNLQGDLAQKDGEGLDRQILAAQIRLAIAEHELQNLDLQIEQSKQVEEFLRTKYTNDQLYTWMLGQLSSLYFQSYQLAYDVAKRAERAWQFELAEPDKSFVQFGYWDSLKKGLLAGERLAHDLRRMEMAYLDTHRREYELTQHVSLRQLDSVGLVKLRTDGECIVRIPEAWFDLDSPGHYMRRLKTVSISLPSVTGPYVPVRCTLTLLSSSVRTSPGAAGAYPRTGPDDPRFRDDGVGIQSIVTSRAQDDGGLFETNLRDERYLPFEGAGAISEWRVELPKQFRQFDYDTISDVILHIRYTARDGGAPLRQAAQSALPSTLQSLVLESQAQRPEGAREGLLHLVSLAQEFPNEWHRFLHPAADATDQGLTIALTKELFPYAVQSGTLRVVGIELFLTVKDPAAYASGTPVRLQLSSPGSASQPLDLSSASLDFGGVPHGILSYGATPRALGDWSLAFREIDNTGAAESVVVDVGDHRRLNPSAVEDLILAIRYQIASRPAHPEEVPS